mgnify:CR=1 FL=1
MSNIRSPYTAGRNRRLVLSAAALAAVFLAACDKAPKTDYERSASLTQPVSQVKVAMVKVEPGRRTGEEVYKSVCTTCHASGTLNAPRTGEAADWAPRIALGFEALVASVTNGKGAMPPKGGGADLTDAELQRAVAYLANLAGGNFTEPPIE